jgi:hypothetical protein
MHLVVALGVDSLLIIVFFGWKLVDNESLITYSYLNRCKSMGHSWERPKMVITSSGMGSVFGLTSGQNGSEREKETEGKGAEECSTMHIVRWMC